MTPGYLLLSTVGVLAGLCLLAGSLQASPNRAGGRRHGRGRRRPQRRALAPTLTEFLEDLMAAIRRLEASNEQLRTVTQHHEQLVSKTIDVTKGNELTLHLSKDTSQNPTATPVQ